ncbi:MAG: hypothetical protein ACJZ86_05640 [Pontiellaceae bacterium]
MSENFEIIKTNNRLPNWTHCAGIALLIVLAVSGAVISHSAIESSTKPVCCGSH